LCSLADNESSTLAKWCFTDLKKWLFFYISQESSLSHESEPHAWETIHRQDPASCHWHPLHRHSIISFQHALVVGLGRFRVDLVVGISLGCRHWHSDPSLDSILVATLKKRSGPPDKTNGNYQPPHKWQKHSTLVIPHPGLPHCTLKRSSVSSKNSDHRARARLSSIGDLTYVQKVS
jgi:hypothetical protein